MLPCAAAPAPHIREEKRMSSEQLTPPPPEGERTAKKPWRKPRLRLVKFFKTRGNPTRGTWAAPEAGDPNTYDPNVS